MLARRKAIRLMPATALFSALVALVPARAADLVTLRNGFSVTCQSHRQSTPDTVRLYLRPETTDGGSTSYMDVPASSILSIETTPEAATAPAPAVAAHRADTPLLGTLLQQSGSAHNVNVALLASVVKAESAGNAHAVSRTGARGLMQLMPGTATQLHVQDSFDPAGNVEGGSTYLDTLLTRYHNDVALALAAYNAGPAAVDRYRGIPPYRETRLYVARVLREFNRLAQAEVVRASAAAATVLPGPAH